jgi:hypothetical protein
MAEEPNYKSTDELKILLDEHIKGASKQDFKNDLDEQWRDSGAEKLYKAEGSKSRRPWATHSGRYAKLKFMSVVLTKKEDIEKFKRLLERNGLTMKEIIEAGFNRGSYENIVKEWRSTQPDNANESSDFDNDDSFGSAQSEPGSEDDYEAGQGHGDEEFDDFLEPADVANAEREVAAATELTEAKAEEAAAGAGAGSNDVSPMERIVAEETAAQSAGSNDVSPMEQIVAEETAAQSAAAQSALNALGGAGAAAPPPPPAAPPPAAPPPAAPPPVNPAPPLLPNTADHLGAQKSSFRIREHAELQEKMQRADKANVEKPETTGMPNISRFGHQRIVSLIAVKHGKDFVYFQRMVSQSRMVSPDYKQRKKQVSIMIAEYGPLFGGIKMATDFTVPECIELLALKEIYKRILGDENAWKNALKSIGQKTQGGSQGGDVDTTNKQAAVVVSLTEDMLQNLSAVPAGGAPAGNHSGTGGPIKTKDPISLWDQRLKNNSNDTNIKPSMGNEFKVRKSRNIMRVNDTIPMNRRVGRPLREAPNPGMLPVFKMRKK